MRQLSGRGTLHVDAKLPLDLLIDCTHLALRVLRTKPECRLRPQRLRILNRAAEPKAQHTLSAVRKIGFCSHDSATLVAVNNTFQPKDPEFNARVRASFARQRVMASLGVELLRVDPGQVELELAFDPELTQQHGFMHAGVIATALDSACGYAAFSLMPADAGVLSVEYKINFLAPAVGEHFRLVGSVVKPGRTLFVCQGEAFSVRTAEEALIATMTCTVMAVYGRDEVRQ